MGLRKAETITHASSFSQGVNRIARADASPNEWSMYRMTFEALADMERAELLIVGSEYFRVYINGKFCTEYSIRSYVFHRAYEVYDVTDYLKEGQNVIALLACEKAHKRVNGLACELKMIKDNTVTSVSEGWKVKKPEDIVGTMTYTIPGPAEIYDARKELTGWKESDFDDSDWDEPLVIGAVDCKPFTDLVQSFQAAQTREEIAPKKLAWFENTEKYPGYDICLNAPGGVYCALMTTVTAKEDTEIFLAPLSGVTSASLDGQTLPLRAKVTLSAGIHTLSIANHGGGKTVFQLRTDDVLTFTKPEGACMPAASDTETAVETESTAFASPWIHFTMEKPSIRYRISWTEKAPKFPVPEELGQFMTAVNFLALPTKMQEACVATPIGECDLWYEIANQQSIDVPEHFEDYPQKPIVIPARKTAVSLMLDYHREHIGLFTMDVDAPVGTEFTFFTFEMFTPSGIRYMGSHIGPHGKYISPAGRRTFISNRKRGYRYAVITIPACDQDIILYGANVIETRYPAEPAGAFQSSDQYLNDIYQISLDTAKVCMMDSYVDCCGCEQNTWVGDAGITAEINMVNFGAREFDGRYLDMIGRSMDDGMAEYYRPGNPRFVNRLHLPCACFPTYPEGGAAIWSFTWVLQVLKHYLYFGADEALEQGLRDIDTCFARCRQQTNDRGLFEVDEAWNLIEWADNDLMTCGEVTANNMMLAYSLDKTAEVLRDLGRDEKACEYEAMAASYREAINRLCWDEEAHAYVDTLRDEKAYAHYVKHHESTGRQVYTYEEYLSCSRISCQTNTLALLFDCVPEDRKQYCVDILLKSVESGVYVTGTPANVVANQEKKLVGVGSPFFLYYTLQTLYKLGCHDLATKVIRRDWGQLLDDGFTTCVETFKLPNGEPGRSVAHAWSASPAIFLMTEVLGIKPVKPGYTEFTVEPHPAGLEFAKGAVPTPYGNITVEWTLKDGIPDIKCEAPAECKRVK